MREESQSTSALQMRRWRAANPSRARANAYAWKSANPDYHRTYSKRWNAEHLDLLRGYTAAWRAVHPEWEVDNHRKQGARRRARIAEVLATLTPQEWEAILDAAGHACIYCGSTKQITQDHLTPISKGGNHTAENVAPACLPCNQSKGAKVVAEFLAEKER